MVLIPLVMFFLNRRRYLLQHGVHWVLPWYRVLFQSDSPAWSITLAELRKAPQGTLGSELAQFLDAQGFEFFPQFERHDVYHVLLGYGIEAEEEARMQFFLLGNGKHSLGVVLAVLGSVILLPEFLRSYYDAWLRGRSGRCIADWRFEYLLQETVVDLRHLIFGGPIASARPFF